MSVSLLNRLLYWNKDISAHTHITLLDRGSNGYIRPVGGTDFTILVKMVINGYTIL